MDFLDNNGFDSFMTQQYMKPTRNLIDIMNLELQQVTGIQQQKEHLDYML